LPTCLTPAGDYIAPIGPKVSLWSRVRTGWPVVPRDGQPDNQRFGRTVQAEFGVFAPTARDSPGRNRIYPFCCHSVLLITISLSAYLVEI